MFRSIFFLAVICFFVITLKSQDDFQIKLVKKGTNSTIYYKSGSQTRLSWIYNVSDSFGMLHAFSCGYLNTLNSYVPLAVEYAGSKFQIASPSTNHNNKCHNQPAKDERDVLGRVTLLQSSDNDTIKYRSFLISNLAPIDEGAYFCKACFSVGVNDTVYYTIEGGIVNLIRIREDKKTPPRLVSTNFMFISVLASAAVLIVLGNCFVYLYSRNQHLRKRIHYSLADDTGNKALLTVDEEDDEDEDTIYQKK